MFRRKREIILYIIIKYYVLYSSLFITDTLKYKKKINRNSIKNVPINGKKICYYILYILSRNAINASLI